ncbi:hypothetical protein BD309DRAFT_975447, partial [Dichomitus squalens]
MFRLDMYATAEKMHVVSGCALRRSSGAWDTPLRLYMQNKGALALLASSTAGL